MANVEVKRGRNGRFRWFLRKGGKFLAMGNPYGFSSQSKAIDNAVKVLSCSVIAEGEYGEMFAGERDFSD